MANYDGPNYLVVAKCFYNFECIRHTFSLPQPVQYYPAHLPGYPLLIRIFDLFIPGPWAMLIVTLLGSVFLTLISYHLFRMFLAADSSRWLALLLLVFPTRLLVLRHIGAPETWFLASTLASIYFFRNHRFVLSALFAALAQSLKSPGVLLLAAYALIAAHQLYQTRNIIAIIKRYFVFLLVPLTIVIIFSFYQYTIGDFWAYFHSGDNFHLSFFPYSVFLSFRSWINTIWLEDIVYIFLLAFLALKQLYLKYKFDIVFIYPLIFTLASIFVAHRDISRYIAPVYPFVFLAFAPYLTRKSSKVVFLLLLPAFLLYAINFIVGNTTPIADWTPYL
jgi:hypothetical protein